MENIETITALMSDFLQKLDLDLMDFLIWLNHFEYLADILEVPDDNKIYLLINMTDYCSLLLIRKAIAGAESEDNSYDTIINILINKYTPYREKNAARYRFVNRYQFDCESARHYADTLTKLIDKCDCNNDDKTSLLLDQFINGLRSEQLRLQLKETRDLTFNIAVNIAESIELEGNKN